MRIVGPGGRRTLPLESFFVLPGQDPARENVLEQGEIVAEVVLPAPARNARGSFRKVRERGAWDFALASVALVLQMNGERVQNAGVVLGGVAPIPWRSSAAEKALTGKPLNAEVAARAAEAAVRGAEPLGQNRYKIPLVEGTVEESLLALV